jgi:hypothetical protein
VAANSRSIWSPIAVSGLAFEYLRTSQAGGAGNVFDDLPGRSQDDSGIGAADEEAAVRASNTRKSNFAF